MANHTPGTWMIYDDGDDEDSSDNINVWIDDRDGGEKYDIATMLLDRPVGERKATARLLASAPELLAALIQLMEWEGNEAGSYSEDDTQQRANEVWQDAFDAIAKAKGDPQ